MNNKHCSKELNNHETKYRQKTVTEKVLFLKVTC
jgi:hypothetical protein